MDPICLIERGSLFLGKITSWSNFLSIHLTFCLFILVCSYVTPPQPPSQCLTDVQASWLWTAPGVFKDYFLAAFEKNPLIERLIKSVRVVFWLNKHPVFTTD